MLFCFVDGTFPFLPSETAIVALAAISRATGSPNLPLLGVGAAVAAFAGDNLAYTIGKHSGIDRLSRQGHPRLQQMLAWAHRELSRRGPMLILIARYIPIGRVAVNLIAGASRFPRRMFVAMDAIACVTWAAYSVGMGVLAGRWMHANPLLGAVVGIVFAVVFGALLDRVARALLREGQHLPVPREGTDAPFSAPGADESPAAESTGISSGRKDPTRAHEETS